MALLESLSLQQAITALETLLHACRKEADGAVRVISTDALATC